jgi:hypothetical protein
MSERQAVEREYLAAANARRTATSDKEIETTQAWVEKAEAAYIAVHPRWPAVWTQNPKEKP